MYNINVWNLFIMNLIIYEMEFNEALKWAHIQFEEMDENMDF
jgi:hypothetical protein